VVPRSSEAFNNCLIKDPFLLPDEKVDFVALPQSGTLARAAAAMWSTVAIDAFAARPINVIPVFVVIFQRGNVNADLPVKVIADSVRASRASPAFWTCLYLRSHYHGNGVICMAELPCDVRGNKLNRSLSALNTIDSRPLRCILWQNSIRWQAPFVYLYKYRSQY
jgi:hypothetical protein